MLLAKDIKVGYGKIPIIFGISLEVHKNEIVTIIGSNGSGKSTIVRAITGLLNPTEGEIVFNGIKINGMAPNKVVLNGIIHVPEGRKLFTRMTIQDNLEIGAYLQKDLKKRAETLEYVFNLFPRLKERKEQRAGTLSGGEQQMLAIGRGLMANPKLLILDEPSLGIMPKLVNRIMEVIQELRDQGLTILLLEQNVKKSLDLADRAYLLQTGRIVAQGKGQELLKNDIVRKAYLGL